MAGVASIVSANQSATDEAEPYEAASSAWEQVL
jgi:hypothetical protein